MKRSSFIFFSSYYDAINELPEDEQGRIYQAIVIYSITGKVPKNLTAIGKACFKLLRPFIDNSIERYETYSANGKKGGRPKREKQEIEKQSESKTKANQNLNESKLKANKNPNESNTKANDNLNRNRNRNNNIYNKQDKTKQENKIEESTSQNDDVVSYSFDKTKYFFEIINEKLKSLYDKNIFDDRLNNRLKSIFEKIVHTQFFRIRGEELTPDKVLENLVNLFIGDDLEVSDRFSNMLNTIDSTQEVNNKFKYTISVFYQQAEQVVSQC